tara:strand:- start:399 stop:572 length:174 start_codon:yes stop_codon:yes gene_type:complete
MNNIYFGYKKDCYGPGIHLGPERDIEDYVSKDLQTKFRELFDRVDVDVDVLVTVNFR